MWQNAFVAMSVAMGESLDDALAALGDDAQSVAALASALRSESREKRARAMAQHLATLAADLDAMETTWRA